MAVPLPLEVIISVARQIAEATPEVGPCHNLLLLPHWSFHLLLPHKAAQSSRMPGEAGPLFFLGLL